jgi:hypothetical protein
MTEPRINSKDGSTAVGGDNTGQVLNVNAREGSTVNLQFEHKVARELPSFLGAVIVLFSKQSLSEYGRGERRPMPAEVLEKVKVGMYLTPVGTICSMPADGRFSARPAGV